MAWVELSRYEAETGDLPEVCMRCGEPATVQNRYRFTWHPGWVYALIPLGYLVYAIVAAALTQNVRCLTFFCDRHKNHWRARTLLIWGTLVVLAAVFGGGFALAGALSSHFSKLAQDWVFGSLGVAAAMLLVCWLISIPIIQGTAIHPTEISERQLRLQRVSPAFVTAVEEYRRSRQGAVLPEDYSRKFQPGRGRRAVGGGEHFAPGGGWPDQPRAKSAPRKTQARPPVRGLAKWADALIVLGLVATLIGVLLACFVPGMWQKEAVLASEPQRVSLSELAARGPGGNPHVVVTDFICGSGYVYETQVNKDGPPPGPDDQGYGSKAWIPLFPKVPLGRPDAEPTAFTVLLETQQQAASGRGVYVLSRRPSMEGLVLPLSQIGLKSDIRNKLAARYPQTDFDRCLLLVQYEARDKDTYSALATLVAFCSGGGLLLGLPAFTLGIFLWRKRRRQRVGASS
jgi:hypothetical protein